MKHFEPFHDKNSIKNNLNKISFDKKELEPILRIYGKMVAMGNWRDYSISCSASSAIFSIFRRSAETPLYMIIKTPRLSKQNRIFSIVAMDGQIIKQGNNLKDVLQILNKDLFKVV